MTPDFQAGLTVGIGIGLTVGWFVTAAVVVAWLLYVVRAER